MQANASPTSESEQAINDLGPLAWVLDELRKSLDGATKAIRRFVRDAELARGSDLESLDASQLRIARQQLHTAVGALEMVGLGEPAKVLRAMEALAQKFVQHPEFCSEDAAAKVERASFALSEYLEGVLRGKSASSVALFPQYRAVLELVGEERIHPAELWSLEWHWIDATLPEQAEALAYDPAVRARMDSAVLKMVKSGSVTSTNALRDIGLGLSAAQEELEPRVFWKIGAAFFEAIALKLCPVDVYVKRAASRVLMQYTTLARGGHDVSDRLAQDLLFFCSQSVPANAADAPVLSAVRQAYGLSQVRAVDYETPQFGRFDPALLVQVRKRIATATETWSALAGGDTNRLKVVSDQFGLVCESILKLHPENSELARALLKAVEITVRSGEPPSTPVAMEVATAILYLDAAYEDMDPTDSHMAERGLRLARRLDHVIAGGQPEPLEAWMEDLYRRVSDRQTMGSVVEELRTALTEIEKSLDQFFRNPKDKVPLHEVPSQLAQMRGVFSVLGLDQASLATLRMRDSVEKFLVDNIDEAAAGSGIFEKLGNSLGALGFLIDMLSYQRALAKKLFVYDESLGEFKPLMGRSEKEIAAAQVAQPIVQPSAPAFVAPKPAVAAPAARPVVPESSDDDGMELKDIFLEEAREVVRNGLEALRELSADPADLGHQTTLRRAFHTLKGSSRMVGFNELGEAAWAMEQMLNSWLAEQKPAGADLLTLSKQAMSGFGRWVEDIAQGTDGAWSAAPFRLAADAMRVDNRLVAMAIPASSALPVTDKTLDLSGLELEVMPDFDSTTLVDFEATQLPTAGPERRRSPQDQDRRRGPPAGAPAAAMDQFDLGDVGDIDFSSLAGVTKSEPALPSVTHVTPPADDLKDFGNLDWGTDTVMGLASESQALPVEGWVSETVMGLASQSHELPAPSVEWGTDTVAGLPTDMQDVTRPSADLPSIDWGELVSSTQPGHGHLAQHTDRVALRPEPELDAPGARENADEQVKVIGTLRIGIPLYNVYLNEADEWSRRLVTELNEWALELHRPISDSSVALAHSLAGSSATVGFRALSEIARALEHALQHVQLHGQGFPAHARIFVAAADNIRHLLHQFAAGFLKEPERELLSALAEIVSTEFAVLNVGDDFAAQRAAEDLKSTAGAKDASKDFSESIGDLSFDFLTAAPQADPPAPQAVAPGQQRGAAQIVVEVHDDDIDSVDNIDPDLFPIFEEEAAELLPVLGGGLRQWAQSPDDMRSRQEVLRVLHTLKGSARLAGAMRMGEMAHRMESVIEQLGTEVVQAAQIEPLLGRFDGLQQTFDDLCAGPDAAEPDQAQTRVETVQAQVSTPVPIEKAAGRSELVAELMKSKSQVNRPVAVPTPVRHASNQSVRVRSQLLDRLVNQAGEVMISRSRLDARLGQLNGSLGELTNNLDKLRDQLRDVEVQSESQMQSRLAQAKDTAQGFDPLEFDRFTRVQELTRMMAESVNDVATVQRNLQRTIEGTEDDLIDQGRQARELQRDLLRTRMLEFEGISERLYGVVRQAGKDAGKQVRLDIVGGTLEIDRGVLDRMAPAFEHMLRNSVAHGIEDVKTREAAGKPAAGTITIGLSQEGNDVSVTFSDDGAGLDLDRIREKAVASGLVSGHEVISDADAADLIFMPGFSTASSITELAGRGIGMDVVRSEVDALGGRIETSTVSGKGTRFKLVLPLTTAVTQVIMLRMGNLTIGVPTNLVEIVKRVTVAERDKAYETGRIDYAGEFLPFFWSGALLQASVRSHERAGKTMPVVIFRSAGQRLAAHVDEVLGNQEVVVKNLGPQLSRLPGLAGMSVLASGAVVLIYNPVALATVYGDKALEMQLAAHAATTPGAEAAPAIGDQPALLAESSELPLVLVVDDSITVRRVTQRLLKREGYRVTLAADGLQALERLQEERPTVVLSDIEMPRMDGFDLARNIRADVKLRDLPIIMITSRIAEKHREHARELGVNNYLGKPYSEDELLSLVRHYCALAVSA
jgi:chemosensory pili system protein ChpA (sensor histidine kinase/response regulator)